jgi:hypothetical protein
MAEGRDDKRRGVEASLDSADGIHKAAMMLMANLTRFGSTPDECLAAARREMGAPGFPRTRASFAIALAAAGDPDGILVLRRLARAEGDPVLREACLRALADLPGLPDPLKGRPRERGRPGKG